MCRLGNLSNAHYSPLLMLPFISSILSSV
jgi:hypothetical protein